MEHKKNMHKLVILIIFFYESVYDVFGHGMLLDPVARGSRWRYDASAPVNYDDNQLFCGGFSVRFQVFYFS